MTERRPCGPLSLLDRRVQSLGCARCGECCEEIVLGFDPRTEDRDRSPENAALYRDYWHVEWVEGRPAKWGRVGYIVTCSAYDAEHRTCTHPNRPPICRDYPHYAKFPESGEKMDRNPLSDGVTACSYQLDTPGWSRHAGRPLIPVEVLRG